MLKHPLLAALFVALTLVQGTLQGLLIWSLREVLIAYSDTAVVSIQLVVVSSLVVFGLWVLRAGTAFSAEVTSARLAYRTEIESMWAVLAKLLNLPMRFFAKSSEGDLIISSYYDLKGVRTTTLQVGKVILHLTTLAGLAVAAWLMSPKLAVLGITVVPLGAIPAYWLGQRITQAADEEREAMTSLYDSFLQVSSGIQVIKVNRADKYISEQARRIGKTLYRHIIRKIQHKALARFLLEAVSGLGLVTILVLGGGDVAAGRLDWESLLGLLIAVMAVYAPIVNLLSVYTNLRGVMPNLARVERIMDAPETMYAQEHPTSLPAAPEVIEFRDVSFAYDEQEVLTGVSATFSKGETIGIVGHSGAGKSTLLSLLLRFYDPTHGEILFDGVSLRDVSYDDLMKRCAIVLQEPFLFLDTLANNIRIGRPEASLEEVMEAARAANIHAEILEMEKGYDTEVGRGRESRGISVGQKQRVAIAAALLKNAPVLFLDEATSSLDSISEQKVQQAIDRLMQGRTTFIIAHRLSTLRNVDRILVLDRGKVVGLGTHAALIASCGAYQKLWAHQVGSLPVPSLQPQS